MTRLQRETVIYVCCVLASLGLMFWIVPAYSPPHPGYGASPALVPEVVAGIILVVSLAALARSVMARWRAIPLPADESAYPEEGKSEGFSQLGRIKVWHLIAIVAPCVLLIPAMDWVGYVPASIVFMLVIQYIVGRRDIVRPVILAVAVVLVLYAAMRYGFSVPLPGA
jgi:hypothetical protein